MDDIPFRQSLEFKASEQETQFWLAAQKGSQNAYNIICAFEITNLDEERFIGAIRKTLSAFQIFRANYAFYNGNLFRNYSGQLLSIHTSSEPTDDTWLEEHCQTEFDLENGPLCRLAITSTAQTNVKRIALVFHHIVIDLASKDIISQLIQKNYAGETAPAELGNDNYHELTMNDVAWLDSESGRRALDYWQKQTSGIEREVAIYASPDSHSRTMGIEDVNLTTQIQTQIFEFATKHNSSPYLILLTAYYEILRRYSLQNNIAVGVPMSLRRDPESQQTLGCLISVAPINVSVAAGDSFLVALRKVRIAMLGAHRHPYHASFIEGTTQSSGAPYKFGFTFEHPMQLELEGTECTSLKINPSEPQLDIFLRCWLDGRNINGALEFDKSQYNRTFSKRFLDSLGVLLTNALITPEIPLAELPITPNTDLAVINKANETQKDLGCGTSLMELFCAQAAKTPELIALKTATTTLTYKELDECTNQLAHELIAQGVKPGNTVALLFSRSVELIKAIYAIQKAGAAYLPIDAELPEDRIHYMSTNAGCIFVLTDMSSPPLSAATIKYLQFNRLSQLSCTQSNNRPEIICAPSDIAYIIYTSGSTGLPKGVANTQTGICNRLLWMQQEFKLSNSDIVLFKTPYNFDVSVWEIFWPLQTGATLAIAEADSHKDPYNIVKQIELLHATVVHFVPAMLSAFLAEGIATANSLRTVICSGEELKQEHQQKFFAKYATTELYNLYGPTEAAVDVTCWKCDPKFQGSILPIGKPIDNTEIYIVDANYNYQPIGVMGELLIGGTQVATGYIGNQELTDKVFIPNPFGSGKVYKTGDFARWTEDGLIEFLGRKDFQVKINGLRIELAEIENVLMNYPNIEIAMVTTFTLGATTNLLAYFNSSNQVPVNQTELSNFLAAKLPSYMVPRHFQQVGKFALTSSGKVDRKQLPEYQVASQAPNPDTSTLNECEQTILATWKEVLDIRHCGLDTGFFECGGDSLSMMSVFSILKDRHHYKLTAVNMFANPTIRSLARFLSGENNASKTTKTSTSNRAQKMRQAMLKPRHRQK